MENKRAADLYWAQFLSHVGAEGNPDYYDVFHFGDEDSADEIAELVLSGIKTSTGSLVWVYEFENRAMPKPGSYSIVTGKAGLPVCIIESTEVKVMPFDEVDEQFAFDGGEGDRSLEGWREMYRDYIQSECLRIGRGPSEQVPMVCERFKVVYSTAPKDEL